MSELLLHGGYPPLPSSTLTIGRIAAILESGALRDIRVDGVEVLRGIYAAVRDPNWLTVPAETLSETVTRSTGKITVKIERRYRLGEIDFQATVLHELIDTGSVATTFEGRALKGFWKNRIGLCILHPTPPGPVLECQTMSADGLWAQSSFPEDIAPHQPFLDLRGLRWRPSEDLEACLLILGEAFEMEDQRNWTDSSLKTYSTPLSIPYPAWIAADDVVRHEVRLLVEQQVPEGSGVRRPKQLTKAEIVVSPSGDIDVPFPRIGIGRSPLGMTYSVDETEAIRDLNLNHLRVEAWPAKPNWRTDFDAGVVEAKLLGLPIELVVFFGDGSRRELDALVEAVKNEPINSILLLQEGQKSTPDALTPTIVGPLRKALPGVPIGVGTDAYFAELNRGRPCTELTEFISYSLNPLVHADDTQTLFENITAQADTIRSARRLATGKQVYVTPVSLKPRYNPNATTSVADVEHGLPSNVDPRQMSNLAAAWLVGSIKTLAEAGCNSATYFECAGPRGLFLPRGSSPLAGFPAHPGDIFPVFSVFRQIMKIEPIAVTPMRSDDPLRCYAVAVRHNLGIRYVIANGSDVLQRVRLSTIHEVNHEMELQPYEIACIDSGPNRKAKPR